MEVYLVKEDVKIVPANKAFSKTMRYSDCVKNCKPCRRKQRSRNEGPRTLLTVARLPVTFKSISSDDDPSWQSGRFAERMERMLKKNPNDKFGNLKLELIIANYEDSLGGYFVLSTGSKMNVFKRLDNKLADTDLEYTTEVSLCHLPTAESAVSPDALVCLKADLNGVWNSEKQDQMNSRFLVRIPQEMTTVWEQGTGFIYSKSSVKITFGADTVNWVYGCNKWIGWPPKDFTSLEIVCKNGEIEKFCREFLEGQSPVFRNKFEEMEKEEKGGPLKLEMETSREGVEAFLEYVSGTEGGVSLGASDFGLALELLKIGHDYQVVGLENAVDEIIMAKGSSDFGYFSVGGALDLFLYAKENVEGLKHMRDKAVRVLHNFTKTANEKIEDSKEYQDLLKNQPEVVAELSALYLQLS